MRDWKRLLPTNTFQEMITLFNQNSDNGKFLDDMTGAILSNGILFEGKETVDGMMIRPLTKVDLSGQVQSNTILDNFTLYFRDTNNLKYLDRFPIDLLSYNDGKIHFLYIKEDLSYRVSDYMFGFADEILLARFVINVDSTWNHFYIMSQRAGTPMYNAADEFYTIDGMYVKSPGGLELSQTSGTVKRSGIDFVDKVSPDIYQFYNLSSERVPLRYVNLYNEVDYSQDTTWNIITNKYMTYNTNKKKKIQAEQYIINIKNLYYLVDSYSNDIAQELHDSIISGAEQIDLRPIIVAYNDYIGKIYNEVMNLYNLLGDSSLSTVRRAGLLENKNDVTNYISNHLNPEGNISELQVIAIRNLPAYILNINPVLYSNPLEFRLQEVQDELDEISYNAGTLNNVPAGKFTIQRILWDIYEQSLIVQYGDTIYNNFDDAVAGTGLLEYPAPFGKTIYIPLAILVIKSGISSINDDLESIIIDRRWVEVDQEQTAYTDYVSRAYALKALQMAQDLIDGVTPANKADNLKYTNNGNTAYANGDFYLEYGNIRNKVQVINDLTHAPYNSLQALSAYQGKVLYDNFANYLPLAGGTMTGQINSRNILPNANNTYSLGDASHYWKTAYVTSLTASNITATKITTTNLNTSGLLNAAGGINTNTINVTNVNGTNINGTRATITNITTTNLSTTNITGTKAEVTNITSTNLSASNGTITNLNVTNLNVSKLNMSGKMNASGGIETTTLNASGRMYANGGINTNTINVSGDIIRTGGGRYVYSGDNTIINIVANSSADIGSAASGTVIFSW